MCGWLVGYLGRISRLFLIVFFFVWCLVIWVWYLWVGLIFWLLLVAGFVGWCSPVCVLLVFKSRRGWATALNLGLSFVGGFWLFVICVLWCFWVWVMWIFLLVRVGCVGVYFVLDVWVTFLMGLIGGCCWMLFRVLFLGVWLLVVTIWFGLLLGFVVWVD